jgi:hypothetical protein
MKNICVFFLKISFLFLLLLSVNGLFIIPAFSATETITLTTYYPSPVGVYRELRAQHEAIGNTYYDASQYCWGGACANQINANADLVVEGNVGIGTILPTLPANSGPCKLGVGGNTGEIGISADNNNNHLIFFDSTGASVARIVKCETSGTGACDAAQGFFIEADGTKKMWFTGMWNAPPYPDVIVRGNMSIGTINPQTPAPNSQPGNLDVNDIWLRAANEGSGQWLSQGGGGGCYVSYSGSCLAGFTKKGSAGTWGYCMLFSAPGGSGNAAYFRPPGAGCDIGWGSRNSGEAFVCCQ